MSARINLPPGCNSLKFSDNSEYYAKRGTSVVVDDRHAAEIKKSGNGQLGIVSGSPALAIGTKKGMRCEGCGFLAQMWSKICPRCGGMTHEEDD